MLIRIGGFQAHARTEHVLRDKVSEIILVHRFDRIDLARIFVYTYILHIYIIPRKNNKKLKKNLCFLLVIYVFCFLFVKK